LPPPSVGLSSASAERASPRSKSWKIEAPPTSRSEKRRHPVITSHAGGPVTRRGSAPWGVSLDVQNCTLGTARSPASSSSKNGSALKLNMLATILLGNISTRFLYRMAASL
jgi:hypothetical protein